MLLLCLCSRLPAAWAAPSHHVPTRCLCLKFQERVHPKAIVKFQVTEKGAHCHRHEIILTIKIKGGQQEMCLDASKRQGEKILRCWERKPQQSPRQLHRCMREQREEARPIL